MTLGKIDNPAEASFDGWQDESSGFGKKSADLALSFAGLIFPPAKIAKIIKDQFSTESRWDRIKYLFTGVRMQLARLESEAGQSREKIQQIRAKLETPEFEEAVAVASEEAARASSQRTVGRFASILVGSLTPTSWYGPPEDVASMIQAVSQLGDIDILVLQELEIAFRGVRGPNFNLHDAYTGNMTQLREAIKRSGLHEDDFHAVCSRLAGFGLALEEARNPSRMQPHERCFRPTHRGETLLAYLGQESAASG